MAERAHDFGYLIYTRLSAEEAVRGGMSLEMQEARCRECAIAGNLPISEVFPDYGFSGKTMDRPGFQAMRERLEGAKGVIVLETGPPVARRTRYLRFHRVVS